LAETAAFRQIPPETSGDFRFSGAFRPSDYSSGAQYRDEEFYLLVKSLPHHRPVILGN
jgi:hypothetical protein